MTLKKLRKRWNIFWQGIWYGVKYRADNLYWGLQYLLNPKHRYHIINLSGMDGYTRGWIDADRQLLYAAFKILVTFVETEAYSKYGRQTWEEWSKGIGPEAKWFRQQYDNEMEVYAIYKWWKWQRPKDYAELDALYEQWGGLSKAQRRKANLALDFETKLYDKDTEMICRMAKVRRTLWT